MSTIRVSDEVKDRLQDLKRDDESFNDLLNRLSRSKKDVAGIAESLAEINDGDLGERMQEAHDDLSKSLDTRVSE